MKKEKENTALDEEKNGNTHDIYVLNWTVVVEYIYNIQRNEKLVKHDINESARHICRI